ncbi:hypothetical protein [Microvirga sp. P5_D2]
MNRHVLGVITASAAAPYIVGTFLFLYAALSSLSSSDAMSLGEALKSSPTVLVFGTFGLIMYGLPVLAGATIAALIIHVLKVRSRSWAVGVGAMTGLCCGLYITFPRFESDWVILPSFLPAGAVCGWIYWRIAIRQTPDPVRPITTP